METTDDQDGLLFIEIDLRKKHWRNSAGVALCRLWGDNFKSKITTAQSPSFNLFSSHGKRGIEPLLESAATFENGGQEEVQQCPELRQLVLQWRSCQEDSAWSQIVGVEHLRQLTVVVFHTVAFIHDHVLPTDLVRRQKRAADEAHSHIGELTPGRLSNSDSLTHTGSVPSQSLELWKKVSGLQHPPLSTVRKPI